MPRILAYIRCSHIDSAVTGLSIDAQINAAKAYAAALPEQLPWSAERSPGDGEPGLFIDSAVSAWKKRLYERPGGKALRDAMRPGDHVLFYSIDRGFRSVYDFSRTIPYWIKEGVHVHLISEGFNLLTANGKLLSNILAAFAQWKSDMISERTKEGLALRAATGKAAERKPKEKEEWSPSHELRSLYGNRTSPTITPGDPGRIFSYARVSHVDSSTSGLSMSSQAEQTERYAKYLQTKRPQLSRGPHFGDEVVSATSDKLRDRPQGSQLDASLQRGDHVVFAKLDRAWRSMRDMLETLDSWKERGITVHFCDMMLDTSSASGEVFLRILCMLAEWEAKVISERTKMALEVRRKQGRPVNNQTPKGFSRRKQGQLTKLVLNPRDIRIMWWIHHMREKHHISFDKIADIVENALAIQEDRRPIPRGGMKGRPRNFARGPSSPKLKTRLLGREFDRTRCFHIHREWPALQPVLAEAIQRRRSVRLRRQAAG